MERYEYSGLVEYITYKGTFLKGSPVMAYFHVTENEEKLLQPDWLFAAMNELGAAGWVDYRVEYPEPKVQGMEVDRVKAFQKRYGWMPGGMQLESTRWFRRVLR